MMIRMFYSLVFMALCASLMASDGKLVCNEGFELGLTGGWFGNNFGKGPGRVECSEDSPYEGKKCAHLLKERGPGGTQLFSPFFPIGNNKKVEISLYYRGSGSLNIGFFHKKDGKFVRTISPLNKPASKYQKLKKADKWTKKNIVLNVPESYLKDEAAIRFQFQRWGSQQPESLYLDNISVKVDQLPEKVAKESGVKKK